MNGPDLALAIEISNPSAAAGAGVALRHSAEGWVESEPLRESIARPAGASRAGHGGHDDDLMPAIDRLFVRCAARPARVGLVLVSIGPGGYTGLRIACAAAKMIAEAAGARCVAVPTAMVVARRVPADAWARGGAAIALASKGTSAWVHAFESCASSAAHGSGGAVLDAAGLAGLMNAGVRTIVADRFFPEPMRRAAADHGVPVIEPVFDPAALFEVPIDAAAGRTAGAAGSLTPMDPVELAPLYPREPDAVTLWRARKPG